MQTGLYVALSSQIALERRLTTIADNVANINTTGFRATEIKFEDVLAQSDGTQVAYVDKGKEFLSPDKGGITQTNNPLDFAIRGDAWFQIQTPAGPALTRDGRFAMTEAGALVSIEGYPVLDAGGGPIQLNGAEGMPSVSRDGIIYQNGQPVSQLGIYEADPAAGFTRVGNTAIQTANQPTAVVDRYDIGIEQGYVEDSNVNGVSQITQLIMVSRAFENITQLMRDSETSMSSAIKTLGGAQ